MEKIITCPHCHTQFDLSINPTSPDEGSNYLWIFDNGHGGMIDGVYQTPASLLVNTVSVNSSSSAKSSVLLNPPVVIINYAFSKVKRENNL